MLRVCLTLHVGQLEVCRDGDDLIVELGDDDTPVEVDGFLVALPREETRDDLGHLGESRRRRVSQVERFECRPVVGGRLAQDHDSAREILPIVPFGDHVFEGTAGGFETR